MAEDTASIGEEAENFIFEVTSLNGNSRENSVPKEACSIAEEEDFDEAPRPPPLNSHQPAIAARRPVGASRPRSFNLGHLNATPIEHHAASCDCRKCQSKLLAYSCIDKEAVLPLIKCSIVSAPTTPMNEISQDIAASWTYGADFPSSRHKLRRDTSYSSVEEELGEELIEERLAPPSSSNILGGKTKSKSRLSLNLLGEKPEKSLGSSPRSPRLIPKFLRSSFSKLLSSSPSKASSNTDTGERERGSGIARSGSSHAFVTSQSLLKGGAESLTSLNNPSIYEDGGSNNSRRNSPDDSILLGDMVAFTPNTKAYLEETKQSGLPVIPFAYPTCVIVEKLKQKNKDLIRSRSKNDSVDNADNADNIVNDCLNVDDIDEHIYVPEPAPLDSLVDIAQQELREDGLVDQDDLELYEDEAFYGSSIGSSIANPPLDLSSRPLSSQNQYAQARWEEAAVIPETEVDLMRSSLSGAYVDMNTTSKEIPRGSNKTMAVPINKI